MNANHQSTQDRAELLRKMMQKYLQELTPQDRDHIMQTHLAQARGPKKNAELLRLMTDSVLRMKQNQTKKDIRRES